MPTNKLHLRFCFLTMLLLVIAAVPATAQSSDPDSPSPLTSNVIEGEGDGQAVVYYYRFAAGPGEVKITVDAKTDYYSTPFVVDLLDEDGKQLEQIYVVATGSGKREVKQHKFLRQMPAILRLSTREDKEVKSLTYKIKLEGEVGLSGGGQSSAAPTPESASIPSLFASPQDTFSAHRRNAPDAEYYTCPLNLPAAVTSVPPQWKLMEFAARFTVDFDSVEAGRQGGKNMVTCNYKTSAGFGVIIFKEIPPTYNCAVTTNPRQVRCSTIIKIPGNK